MIQTNENSHRADAGLSFFSQMTASFTHDIKNILAIINENAGLLDDLLFMVNRGLPLDHGKIRLIAEKVRNQVRRADELVRTMNTFAHSRDHEIGQINIPEFVTMLLHLTRRLQAKYGPNVELTVEDPRMTLTTAPFYFLNLFWLCLEFVMKNRENDDTPASISFKQNTDRVTLVFNGLRKNLTAEDIPLSLPDATHLHTFLEADVNFLPTEGELLLSFPFLLGK